MTAPDLPTPTEPRMDPDLHAIWSRARVQDSHLPDITRLPLALARQQFNATNARWNVFDESLFDEGALSLDCPGRQLPLSAWRVCVRGQAPVCRILYLHGGGWVFGNPQTHRGAMAQLALQCQAEVIGVDYAKAPEAPFPAGLDDAVAASRALQASSRHGLALAIAGDSAGANLALAALLALRDSGAQPFQAALLFYGVFGDDHGTQSHRLVGDGRFGLSSAKMDFYRGHYLRGTGVSPGDPRVSPLWADLSRLPPLFISAAGLDPLHDDSVALDLKVRAAGGTAMLKVYTGVHHGFMQMSWLLPKARLAFVDAAQALATFLR